VTSLYHRCIQNFVLDVIKKCPVDFVYSGAVSVDTVAKCGLLYRNENSRYLAVTLLIYLRVMMILRGRNV